MALRGKRFVYFQEPDSDTPLNMPVLKNLLAGNDTITCRGLHKSMISFYPQWHFFGACNQLGALSQDDGGSRRRILLQAFESKFIPQSDMGKAIYQGENGLLDNIHAQDTSVDRNIDSGKWRLPMMWLLLEYWQEYQDIIYNGGDNQGQLTPPDKIQEQTDRYFKDQSVVRDWLDSILEYNPENTSGSVWIVTEKELRDRRSGEVRNKHPNMPQLKALLEGHNYLGKQIKSEVINGIEYKKFWKGARLEDSTESGNEDF